ncbi:MAG: alpha-L-rhamnosidase, partial [Bryobacterales bacterium]|nr:alpha-L-rhamnosidase [Bryobacterales bacterium]
SSERTLRSNTGDLWDSGRVESAQSAHVAYEGGPMSSGAVAFWKVQVWDEGGKASEWSAPGRWSMGLLDAADWKGKWIGRDEEKLYRDPESPYWILEKAHWIWAADNKPEASFRTTVKVPADRKIRSATLVAAADRELELILNGESLGKDARGAIPRVFDVSLRPGENAIEIRAKQSAVIAAIKVEFDRGEPMIFSTNGNWTASGSPARDRGVYGAQPWGEIGFKEERALPARMLRKQFRVARKPKSATAYICGLGLFELSVNGRKLGDQVLAPGLTDYTKRSQYMTFDVTPQIAAGANAIGILLGNGRFWAPRERDPIAMLSYGYPKAIFQLDLTYDDGSVEHIVSDETWKLSTNGPIRANNEYDGERYDARLESAWTRTGFDDSKWEAAHVAAGPKGVLVAQMAEPLRVTETLHPVSIHKLSSNSYIFDMGQNMVGWCRLKVAGPKGTRVVLRHAETLQEDGRLYIANLRSARATDTYILRGGGAESYEPRFTYHGFRYVEVTGYPGVPNLNSIEGRVVHDDMAPSADFVTSNALLNQIHKNIFWGVRGNYRSIPTDCPQRDERQGWLGDRSQVSRSESYLFDVAAFYSKWMQDLADAQRPDGSIPDVAPNYWSIYNDDVTWPSTFILIPGMLYEQYGERRVLERDYPAMKKWIEHMRTFLKNDIMPKDTYGDWCVPPESPKLIHSEDPARKTDGTLLGTAYYYDLLRRMAVYARILEKPEEAEAFDKVAARVNAAFQRQFFNPATGLYGNGTQTSSILPLAFGMTPLDKRGPVFDSLIEKVEVESKGHIGTGLVGAQWLMRTLSENGRADVAFQIANQKTYPGWGYMVEKGATTIWELWNGDTADPAMNSGNHVMQIGDLAVWMYEYLAGIRPDPARPGFAHTVIRPYPVADLTFVRASHKSMYGLIRSEWKREGGNFELDVTVPPNTTATVYVPARDAGAVTESGRAASLSPGVSFLRMDSGAALFDVPSGTYKFIVKEK